MSLSSWSPQQALDAWTGLAPVSTWLRRCPKLPRIPFMFFIVLNDAIGADVQVTNFALVNVGGAEFGAALDAVGDCRVGAVIG
jgi:hypothetical protein